MAFLSAGCLAVGTTLVMKAIALLIILLAASSRAHADEPKGAQALMGAQAVKTQKEPRRAPIAPPRPGAPAPGKRVGYGGYFTEVFRSEKKRPFFNLRTPIDPAKDLENIWFYPGTDKIQGVVLFSIKF